MSYTQLLMSAYNKPNIGVREILIGIAITALVFGALAFFTRKLDK